MPEETSFLKKRITCEFANPHGHDFIIFLYKSQSFSMFLLNIFTTSILIACYSGLWFIATWLEYSELLFF